MVFMSRVNLVGENKTYTIDTGDWGGPTEAKAGDIVRYSLDGGDYIPPGRVIAEDGTEIPLTSGFGPAYARVASGYHYMFVMPSQNVTLASIG